MRKKLLRYDYNKRMGIKMTDYLRINALEISKHPSLLLQLWLKLQGRLDTLELGGSNSKFQTVAKERGNYSTIFFRALLQITNIEDKWEIWRLMIGYVNKGICHLKI